MKIARIVVYRVELPAAGGVYYLSGGRSFTSYESTLVRIETDDGCIGWGEACPFGKGYGAAHPGGIRAGIAEMAPALMGLDPRDSQRVQEAMEAVLPGLPFTKAAIDMACWDLFGRSQGLPCYRLLGGLARSELPLISSVSTGTPAEMIAKVEAFRAQGYLAHSIKVGGDLPEADVARIRALLEARQAGEDYIVDVNRGWTLDTALKVVSQLDGLDFALEQPCATYRECRALKPHLRQPLSLDEVLDSPALLLQALADGAIDFANIKLCKVGGLTPAKAMAEICAAAGLGISLQETCGSDVAFAAICHLAAAVSPRVLRHVWDPRELAGLTTAEGAPEIRAGRAHLSDRPGLGIAPLPAVLGDAVAVYG
ncbi:MAG: mandelate racemase/muconate lactonizing enzyme family protein [Rhodospirillales bacterium]